MKLSDLPKIEDWKAPWELKGEDFDEEAARRYIYTLTKDKLTVQGREEKAKADLSAEQSAHTETKSKLQTAEAAGPDKDAVEKAQAAQRDAEDKASKAELRALRYEVAADKEVPLAQAKRLQGTTKEELEADADEFLQSFGATANGGAEDEEEDPEDETIVRRSPRRLVNPVDDGASTRQRTAEIDISSIPRL